MATATHTNVINLQPGGPRVSVAANRILLECRDLSARRLREALREMLKNASDDLLGKADVSTEANERRILQSLAEKLTDKGGRLEGQLAAHWGQEFDAALKAANHPAATSNILLEDMQIVDYGEMEEELAQKALVRRLEDKCEEALYALSRRFSHLAGQENVAGSRNPVGPEVVMRALRNALRDTDFDAQHRQELFRYLEGSIDTHIAPIYHALNTHLLQHRVLPDLRRDYGRSSAARQDATKEITADKPAGDIFSVLQSLVSGATPPQGIPAMLGLPQAAAGLPASFAAFAGAGAAASAGAPPPPHVWASLDTLQRATPAAMASPPMASGMGNVLHQFRDSDVGQQLGQLDAITVDIVAMLFDMIFDDREISDPIKALVGKLQIPVLKVAMLDKSFFSSKAHPTRRLLDLISRAALRWGKQVGRDDPVYLKIAEVIDHIHDNFQQDTALFETLCADFEHFLDVRESDLSGKVSRAALLVVQRELEELADMAVESELQLWLAGEPPRAVADLLNHEWRMLLRQIHLQEGPDSEPWKNALATAGDLMDSVRQKSDAKERQALARQLPVLIKQLSAGFDRISVAGDRRRRLLDGLFSLHAAALRGTEPPPPETEEAGTPEPESDQPDLASQSLGDGEVTVESITVTAPFGANDAIAEVAALQRGDWVEYVQADGTALRYRLSWVSPQRGILLFTNPESPNAIAVSPEAMSLQVQRGEVRILSSEPIFDRALTRTIDILQAA